MWQRFSDEARQAMLRAQQEAAKRGSAVVGAEHLLLGMVVDDTFAVQALQRLGVAPETVRLALRVDLGEALPGDGLPPEPKLTASARRVVELGASEAYRMRHNFIGTGHLLIGLLRLREGGGLPVESLFDLALHKLNLMSAETLQQRCRARTPEVSQATLLLEELGVSRDATRLAVLNLHDSQDVPYDGIWTEQGRRAIAAAQREARLMGNGRIGTGHLLLGLLSVPDSLAAQTLAGLGLPLPTARAAVRAGNVSDHEISGPKPRFTPAARRALDRAQRAAQRLGHRYIGPEHILLGLLPSRDGWFARSHNDDPAVQVLSGAGLALDEVRRRLGGGKPHKARRHTRQDNAPVPIRLGLALGLAPSLCWLPLSWPSSVLATLGMPQAVVVTLAFVPIAGGFGVAGIILFSRSVRLKSAGYWFVGGFLLAILLTLALLDYPN